MTQQRDERTGEFVLEAPDLDTDAIRQEIQERSHARRAEAAAEGIDYEAYARGLFPLPGDAMLSRRLYESLRHVELASEKVHVEMILTESRVPLIGNLVQRLRKALHELVLFYVNNLAAKQTRFNVQTAQAFAAVVQELEQEVREQRARVAGLEGHQD